MNLHLQYPVPEVNYGMNGPKGIKRQSFSVGDGVFEKSPKRKTWCLGSMKAFSGSVFGRDTYQKTIKTPFTSLSV